jgi:hypothetical protein
VPRGFKIADAWVQVHAEADEETLRDADRAGQQVGERVAKGTEGKTTESVRKELKDLPSKTSRESDDSGRGLGDKLSRGMSLAIVRNSPLIAAAVGGAIMLGAPVALGAAAVLFAGIGALAASQSAKVRSSWTGAFQQIKQGAIDDAQVLVPTLVGAATQIAGGFQRMRPQIQQAFSASGPVIDSFVRGILALAQNALPGLVRAVERAGPVVAGLEKFLGSTGTGLTQFFDGMSTHSAAAGRTFASLGVSVQALLGILGQLLGTGTEIASVVLPMLGGSLQVVLAALRMLQPVLPSVVMGFTGFKVASAASGYLKTFAQNLAFASYGSGPFASSMGKAASAASGLGKALPVIGIALGLMGADVEAASNKTDSWTQALLKGGQAAADARKQYDNGSYFLRSLDEWAGLAPSMKDAQKAAQDYLKSLTPLGRAQHDQSVYQNELNEALKNQDAEGAARALDKYEAASRRVEAVQAREQRAIEGVTKAMVDQADTARGRVDAEFAYGNAQNAVAKAQDAYNKVLADTKHTSEEAQQASYDLQQAYRDQIFAAEDLAKSRLPAAMNDEQKAIIGAKAALDEMNKMISNGITLDPTLERYRQQLIQITGQADGAKLAQAQLSSAISELGYTVKSLPDGKSIRIDAPTDELIHRLKLLGLTVTTMPDGSVTVSADTDKAKGKLGELSDDLVNLGRKKTAPTVSITDKTPKTYSDIIDRLLDISRQRPKPPADINTGPAKGHYDVMMGMLGNLGKQTPTPVAGLRNLASGPLAQILAGINALYSKTITVRTNYVANYVSTGARPGTTMVPSLSSTGGPIRAASGRVVGPGDGSVDTVPAINVDTGHAWALANHEWIIKALSSRMYGDTRMQAVNDGTATVLLPSEVPSVRQGAMGLSAPVAAGGSSGASASSSRTSGPVVAGDLHVHLEGSFDFSNQASLRRAAVMFRDEIVKLERSER